MSKKYIFFNQKDKP